MKYQYVTKKEVAPVRKELLDIIHEVQTAVRDKFTFQFEFVGSSRWNMITREENANRGYDFDVNLQMQKCKEKLTPKEIKQTLMRAFNQAIKQRRYHPCEDSTRVITIKVMDQRNGRIEYSCDFAIVRAHPGNGGICQQYIHFQKEQNQYSWKQLPEPPHLEEAIAQIKQHGQWSEVYSRYLEKKNQSPKGEKSSRAQFAETIQEVFNMVKSGKGEKMKNTVSSKTHTQAQLNHYANQHNPNNAAYRANQNNHANQCSPNHPEYKGQKSEGIKKKQ